MKQYKYSWQEKQLREGTYKDSLRKQPNAIGRTHGVISCPTGYGKSGIIFDDIIYHLKNANENNYKIIINLCSPVLLLCRETASNFIDLLSHTQDIHGFNNDDIKVVVNNSDDTYYSKGHDNIRFNNFVKNYNTSNFKVVIIISCNKSLPKLIDALKDGSFSDALICTYLDEAHTLSVYDEHDLEENIQKIDLNTLCAKSNYLYLISATNKEELVKTVNNFDTNENDDQPIFIVHPKDAIQNNIICSPSLHFLSIDKFTNKSREEICKKIYNNLISPEFNKNYNKNLKHKILVSMHDTPSAKSLVKSLSKLGRKVFLTTAETGQMFYDGKNKPKVFKNTLEFTKAIEDCDDHCFVVHIRQLICGIDVSGLTDCIIFKNDLKDDKTYANVIQTIGRCLRLPREERGLDINKRTKKTAEVFFITNADDQTANAVLGTFFINYYGINCIKFNCGYPANYITKHFDEIIKPDSSGLRFPNEQDFVNTYFNEVFINLENWMKTTIVYRNESRKRHGFGKYLLSDKEIDNVIKKATNFNNQIYYTTKYFNNSNDELRKIIEELYDKYIK